jgi:hypothetical protein
MIRAGAIMGSDQEVEPAPQALRRQALLGHQGSQPRRATLQPARGHRVAQRALFEKWR